MSKRTSSRTRERGEEVKVKTVKINVPKLQGEPNRRKQKVIGEEENGK